MSKHMLSISCKSATNKLSCQLDAATIFALHRNSICDLVATKVGKIESSYYNTLLRKSKDRKRLMNASKHEKKH